MKHRWLSELKTVENKHTGATRYYIKKCDVWSRVSREDWESRAADSTRKDSFITKSIGDNWHRFMTVYGHYYS